MSNAMSATVVNQPQSSRGRWPLPTSLIFGIPGEHAADPLVMDAVLNEAGLVYGHDAGERSSSRANWRLWSKDPVYQCPL
eukprot:2247060-Amphidinium_carterae.1